MPNNFAYIEKTLPGRVDEVFVKESLTQSLLGASDVKLDFVDNKILKVFKTVATGTTSYKRGGHGLGANDEGAVQSSLETFMIIPERWFSLPFDKLDRMEDADTVYAHQIQNYVKEHLVPEADTYRFAKMAGFTSELLGNRVVEAIAASDESGILAKLMAAFEWMSEHKVPEKDQVVYVNPAIMTAIRTSKELVRYLSQSEYKGDVNFTIEKFMGREIVEVPSDMFYTDATYGSNGINPVAGSKVINFMVVYKKAIIITERLNWSKIYDSDSQDIGFVGAKYDGLINHDLFVLDNKKVGLYASVSTTSAQAKTAVLNIDAVAAGDGAKTKLTLAITTPATIMWDKIGLYTTNGTAPAVGTTYTTADVAEIGANGEVEFKAFTKNGSHNIFVASYNGKVVATSADIAAAKLPA